MKLFRKIYLQVSVAMVILASVLLLFLLQETQKESLQDTVSYEVEQFRLQIQRFGEKMDERSVQSSGGVLTEVAAAYQFHRIFGTRGALYFNDKELYNMSPYAYDMESLQKQDRNLKNPGGKYGVIVSRPQTAGDKRLLIFCGETQTRELNSYRIVQYRDVTNIYERTEKLGLWGIGFTVLALLAIGAVLFRGIYRSLHPIMDLKNAAAAIADGAYGSRVAVRNGKKGRFCRQYQGQDEIDELAESFNRMAGKVEEHMAALCEVNEKQRELLGSLAHELKTPLTAIIGYAQTLRAPDLSDRNRSKALGYIYSEGKRMARLSEKLLELTGLYESSEDTLDFQEVKLAELFRRLEELTAFRRSEKQIGMEISCEPSSLTHRIDQDLMMSLLMNLVDNGCKASPENGLILVAADDAGIYVEDHGKGIPSGEIDRVTEAFYMVDKSRSRRAGNVGLGLALCRQIAVMHGADLEIESKEGEGTRISILWGEA